MGVIRMVRASLRGLLADRTALMAENLALRQQINVLHRSVKRPKLRKRDRIFRVWWSRLWPTRFIGGRAVRPGNPETCDGLRTAHGKLRHTCSQPPTFPDLAVSAPGIELRRPE